MILVITLLNSCNTNTLKGKVMYVFYFTNLTITEYQLTFITDEIVERRTTLTANSYECITYKNTPELTKEVKLYHYTYKDHILEMPEIRLITKITGDGDIYQSSSEVLYTNSIVESLDNKKRIEEIINSSQGSNVAKMYLEMLQNNNEPLIIEKDGKYVPNPKNKHNKIDEIDTSETCGY